MALTSAGRVVQCLLADVSVQDVGGRVSDVMRRDENLCQVDLDLDLKRCQRRREVEEEEEEEAASMSGYIHRRTSGSCDLL